MRRWLTVAFWSTTPVVGLTTPLRTTRRRLLEGLTTIASPVLAYSSEKYDQYAAEYDTLDSGSLAKGLGIFEMREKYLRGLRGDILEVCAGTGLNSEFYDAKTVTYVDMSAGMLEVAKKRQPRGRYVVGDARALPFRNASFDAVVETFCLCVNDDPVATLREMHRVTKPGGDVVLLDNTRPHRLLQAAFLDATGPILSAADLNKQCRPDKLDLNKILQDLDLFDVKDSDDFGFGFFQALRLTPKSSR